MAPCCTALPGLALPGLCGGRRAAAPPCQEVKPQEGPPWVIIAFTVNLVFGLIISQVSAMALSSKAHHVWEETVKLLTMAALSFIMVNVGYEFSLDKSNMRQYAKDFAVAMTAAALPSALVSLWILLMLPDPPRWEVALLSGLFAAATSAGILFSMLEAAGLKETWLFGKARVLAVFDDLGTLLLLVPLKILVSGFKWELGVEVGMVLVMLAVGYWKLHALPLPSTCAWTALYALVVTALCWLVHWVTDEHLAMQAIHMEVLLPAFVLGCMTHVKHSEEVKDVEVGREESIASAASIAELKAAREERIKTGVSMVFMMLVGLSMPSLVGEPQPHGAHGGEHQEPTHESHEKAHDLGYGMLACHVLVVNLLMVVGKMLPATCYKKEASLKTRLALSLGMCPRGEVGAGIIVISLGMGMHGSSVKVAVLSLALNLMLSSVFIVMVKRLVRDGEGPAFKEAVEASTAPTRSPASEEESKISSENSDADGEEGAQEDIETEDIETEVIETEDIETEDIETGAQASPQAKGAVELSSKEPSSKELANSPAAVQGESYPTLLGRH